MKHCINCQKYLICFSDCFYFHSLNQMIFLKVMFQNKTIKMFQSEMIEKKMIWMYIISFLPYSLIWVQITQEIKPNMILVLPPNKILLHSEKNIASFSHTALCSASMHFSKLPLQLLFLFIIYISTCGVRGLSGDILKIQSLSLKPHNFQHLQGISMHEIIQIWYSLWIS